MTWWQQPFFQVALPIIVTFALATWYQSSRDAIEKRLSSIEDLLRDHDRRITTLEERTSPIRK